jgi:uncharacterized protein YggT (Ycf19 family)
MTTIQLLYCAADIVQFAIGAYVIWYGFNMVCRRWDRTDLEYRAGQCLVVLGAIILLMLRRVM